MTEPRTVTAREIILSKALKEIVEMEHAEGCLTEWGLDDGTPLNWECDCHVAIAEKALEDAK